MTLARKKLIAKRLPLDTYGADIRLLVGHVDDINTYLKSHFDGEFPKDARAYHALYPAPNRTATDINVICLATDMCATKIDLITSLSHECVHLVFDVLARRGVTFDDERDEPFAYYFEWVFGQCLRRIM